MLLGGLSAFLAANKDFIPAMSAKNLYHDNIKAIDRGCIQTLAAYYTVLGAVHCHRTGRPFVRITSTDKPMINNLFLMMGLIEDDTSVRSQTILHAMNQIWISGVDHEMNNSNSALLHAASTLADPVSCFMSALASSYGILHFGAVESVYTMLQKIGTPNNVAVTIAACKATRQRIMGVGHRVYKSRDPRIEPLKGLLYSLAAEGMKDPLLDVAYELERQVHSDKHFVERKLCVNVDLYWPLAYTAM
jgi:citrate synthase